MLPPFRAMLKEAGRAEADVPVTLFGVGMNGDALKFFEKRGYSVNWLTVSYNPKLDRDVQSVGLSKLLSDEGGTGYGQEF